MVAETDEEIEIRKRRVQLLCVDFTDGDLLRELNRRGRVRIMETNRIYYPDTNRSNFAAYLKFIDGSLARSLGNYLQAENMVHVNDQTDRPIIGPTGEKTIVRQMSVVIVIPPKLPKEQANGNKTQG